METPEKIEEAKPKRQRKPKEPAVITVHAPAKKPWELSATEVELVKNHIAKGASDSELAFCLGVARRYKLDPFRGQIWFVKRRDKNLDRYDKEKKEKVAGYKWIPIVGINGLLHIAARDHKKQFGSIGRVEYGPMIEAEWREGEWQGPQGQKHWVVTKVHKLKVPEWARVQVVKRGEAIPTIGEVFWEEIYPNVDSSPLVRQMPRLMLGKCAKAQAVRAAYPATDGLYIQEEFMVEQYEPSENAKLAEARVGAIDERIGTFKALNQGKPPNEEQVTRLEAGESPEQVLLEASLKPVPAEVQADIWPKRPEGPSTREPGAEG